MAHPATRSRGDRVAGCRRCRRRSPTRPAAGHHGRLPADAEATRAGELAARFGDEGVVPAVVVYERDGGLTPADRAHIEAVTSRLAGLPGLAGPPSEAFPSEDGAAASQTLTVVEGSLTDTVPRVRDTARDGAPDGLRVHVTGSAGFVADLVGAFGAIDGLLLAVTAAVVALILILVYRSPLLPLVVLVGAGLALGAASAVVYVLARARWLVLNGESQGIMLILVFGAATDYALLLVAATGRSWPPARTGSPRWPWRGAAPPVRSSPPAPP